MKDYVRKMVEVICGYKQYGELRREGMTVLYALSAKHSMTYLCRSPRSLHHTLWLRLWQAGIHVLKKAIAISFVVQCTILDDVCIAEP